MDEASDLQGRQIIIRSSRELTDEEANRLEKKLREELACLNPVLPSQPSVNRRPKMTMPSTTALILAPQFRPSSLTLKPKATR